MENNFNQLRSPLEAPQFQVSGSTPNMSGQDMQLPQGSQAFPPPSSEYLQPQPISNMLASASPQVLKEKIEDLKALTNKVIVPLFGLNMYQ